MPVDMDGNRADVVAFAKGAVSRLNPGQFYEQYVNAASRDMSKWVRAKFGTLPLNEIWDRLMAYYKAAAPEMEEALSKNYTTTQEKDSHIRSVVESGIYLMISPDAPHLGPNMFFEIEKVISPTYGPVTYTDLSGRRVTTKDKVFIGSLDMIVLEKTEQRPMSVSSAMLQHHGLISGNNREIRNAHPSKQQSTRVLGETECRLVAATMGPEALAELLDLANNPESHRHAVRSILKANTPSKIRELVNRKELPVGNSRVLALFNHILLCAGTMIIDEK